ncbi:MAG: efflux RND transporter periplasmic adaptor subunit [Desulfuromonadaceae bacterium]|nr:efflux RND transporter periplasmic adaptor subunit [Desulfuromonadaceae bacterium]
MKPGGRKNLILTVVVAGLLLGLLWSLGSLWLKGDEKESGRGMRPVPVEVVEIEQGPIVLRRTFSGALEARAEFVVAPKVGGRVERLLVNIADPVQRGQAVGELDNDEYVQEVAQAQAELAVAKANLAQARGALAIAGRDFERVRTLRGRGVASESQLDAARADQVAKQAEFEVAQAQVARADSALETARIRLGYTRITASWSGGSDLRVVAERFVDEGGMVAANAPLLRIVELDPLMGVIHVAERDYSRLRPGQPVILTTDAFPDREFPGRIERIAPVFKQATRQARVELVVDNSRQRLKPGMFIRATVTFDRIPDAVIVPEEALARRENRHGVFLVNADGRSVAWREVTVGIRDGSRVQIEGEGLSGRVVTLGQQLLKDGSAIIIPTERTSGAGNGKKTAGP